MTMDEHIHLQVGDKVFYYIRPCLRQLHTFNMSIKTKVIKSVNDKYNFPTTYHYRSLIEAKHAKLLYMRNAIKDMKVIHDWEITIYSPNKPSTKQLKDKFNIIMLQKNVQDIINTYPEDFI